MGGFPEIIISGYTSSNDLRRFISPALVFMESPVMILKRIWFFLAFKIMDFKDSTYSGKYKSPSIMTLFLGF